MTRILIVDDSSFQRRRICETMKAEGYETLEAPDGRKGLEVATTEVPDCILTDLVMPEMDGIELLAALAQQGVKIPVIVLTADIQDSTRERCLALGAFALLTKPPKKDELCATMKKVLTSKEEAVSCV